MDIDIDFQDRGQALQVLRHIPASRDHNGTLVKHASGVYLHRVPVDAPTGLCAVPFDQAEQNGWFKIDFLNAGIYQGIRDEQHLDQLLAQEPMWELLREPEFVSQLYHINGHADLLQQHSPTTVTQLAAVLAMIRPAKRWLIGHDWDTILEHAWTKPANGEYAFKHSHSLAYAMAIVVQMNLICEQLLGSGLADQRD